jgi:biotin operon repressor
LPADLQLKLLELTRHGQRISFEGLAQELHAGRATLVSQIEGLQAKGLIAFSQQNLELDARQRIMLAEELVHNGRDPQRVSRFLDWQEFEDFAVLSFEENEYFTAKHVVFKTRGARREVDILAWNDTFLFAVDCKHWLRGLSPARIRDAVRAQVERSAALAGRPEILRKFGVLQASRRRIIPTILTLGNARQTVVDRVPVVSISKLMSFLYGISPLDERFFMFPVKDLGMATLAGEEPKA